MIAFKFFPKCKFLFSKDTMKARVIQHESIELTDMGSHSPLCEDNMIAESIFCKGVEDNSLRCEIEKILVNHGISFQEVTFEMEDESCYENRVSAPYVRVKCATGRVPHSTWFEAKGQIADVLLKRDLGIFKIDIKSDMPDRPVEPVRCLKNKPSASRLGWFRLLG